MLNTVFAICGLAGAIVLLVLVPINIFERREAQKQYRALASAILKRTVGIDPGKAEEKPKAEEPTENPDQKMEVTHSIQ